jgi:hypothetical protein
MLACGVHPELQVVVAVARRVTAEFDAWIINETETRVSPRRDLAGY